MDALNYILTKYGLENKKPYPIEIPNTGRDDLAVLFAELGFLTGAEIGTAEGRYAEILCKNNPGLILHCVDPWETYSNYRDYTDQEKLTNAYITARKRLYNYPVSFHKKYSMDAVGSFPDESLDFVYIDANHEWPYVTQDVYHWSKKVRPGGIVAGHDYYFIRRASAKCQVKPAVDSFTWAYQIKPWFVLGSRDKIPGLKRDNCRSWFWVKPYV